jgi:transcriptional regulator with XRE-family HTH domain
MSEFRLDNYLRMHRKRADFSQGEVAFLLGLENGSDVSRHEQNRRVPSLDAALAYEVILGQPVAELFAGRIERLSRRLSLRANRLAGTFDPDDPDLAAKLASLMRIANRSPLT